MIAGLKSPGDVEAEIRMSRMTFRGAFLLLEGEDDSRFWSARVARTGCELVIGGSKPAVVGSIIRLDKTSFQGAVGLVDDDCDRLLGAHSGSPNLLHTDTRDLEGLFLRSSALEKILGEFGDPEKIRAFEARGRSIREALLERALPLGRLRFLSYRDQLALDFKPLIVSRFLDDTTWTFNERALHQVALLQGKYPDPSALAAALATVPAVDPWQLCQGHDLVGILSIGLAQVLGHKKPGVDRVAAHLRAGIEGPELHQTTVVRELRQWEGCNSPYRVLP